MVLDLFAGFSEEAWKAQQAAMGSTRGSAGEDIEPAGKGINIIIIFLSSIIATDSLYVVMFGGK